MLRQLDYAVNDGTCDFLPIVIVRCRSLIGMLEIPNTHAVDVYSNEGDTISIEITEGHWRMSAEIGKTSANYYIIYADGTLMMYENGNKSMEEMATQMNSNQ